MVTRQDTQQQQRALLDNIPDMAWLKDRDCRYLAVNTAYLETLRIPEHSVLGKRPDEIWPPEIAEVYLRTDRAVLKSGRRRQGNRVKEFSVRGGWQGSRHPNRRPYA